MRRSIADHGKKAGAPGGHGRKHGGSKDHRARQVAITGRMPTVRLESRLSHHIPECNKVRGQKARLLGY